MKRFFATLLALAMLIATFAMAEAPSTAEREEAVFNELANIYDSALYFLEQRQTTWEGTIDNADGKYDFQWFYSSIMCPNHDIERATVISMFALNAGYITGASSTNYEEIYNGLFLPFLDRAGRDADGIRTACALFNAMVFYDMTMPDRLEAQKAAIKQLMTDAPDSPNLSSLQDLYKKCSVLLDYAENSDDSYMTTQSRISDFQQERRELKSEFEFVFDWPEFKYSAPQGVPEMYQNVIADKNVAREEDYQKALSYENEGSYFAALRIFEMLGDYKDTGEHIGTCREGVYQNALDELASGNYESAVFYFERLDDYKDSQTQLVEAQAGLYEQALALEEQGELAAAYRQYSQLSGYQDADFRAAMLIDRIGLQTSHATGAVFAKTPEDAAKGSMKNTKITTYQYDENDVLVSDHCEDNSYKYFTLATDTVYSYDEAGTLLSKHTEGDSVVRTANNPSSAGDFVIGAYYSDIIYDAHGNMLSWRSVRHDPENNKDNIDDYEYTYIYDDQGRKTSESHALGDSQSVTEYLYDGNGNLTEERHSYRNELSYVDTYDEHGNRLETISYDKGTISRQTRFTNTYDEAGRLISVDAERDGESFYHKIVEYDVAQEIDDIVYTVTSVYYYDRDKSSSGTTFTKEVDEYHIATATD